MRSHASDGAPMRWLETFNKSMDVYPPLPSGARKEMRSTNLSTASDIVPIFARPRAAVDVDCPRAIRSCGSDDVPSVGRVGG
jgi:hypothetical protein